MDHPRARDGRVKKHNRPGNLPGRISDGRPSRNGLVAISQFQRLIGRMKSPLRLADFALERGEIAGLNRQIAVSDSYLPLTYHDAEMAVIQRPCRPWNMELPKNGLSLNFYGDSSWSRSRCKVSQSRI